jgi:hypothetical protein
MDMVRKLRGPRNFFDQLAHTSLLDINGDHAMGQLARVLVKCINNTFEKELQVHVSGF